MYVCMCVCVCVCVCIYIRNSFGLIEYNDNVGGSVGLVCVLFEFSVGLVWV